MFFANFGTSINKFRKERMNLPFEKIPGFQNLFTDYVSNFEKVSDYYKINFRDEKNWLQLFHSVASQKNAKEFLLAELILEQYDDSDIHLKVEENIKLLNSKNTIAVITGQQLGILGGPLYTIYKTISAIQLCDLLNKKFLEYNFVPIFWMEGEDHDFEEVRSAGFLDANNKFVSVVYDDGISPDEPRGPVASIKFQNDAIEKFILDLKAILRETEFTNDLMQLISSSLYDGTFLSATKIIMKRLFDKYGLILFDPSHPSTKKYLKPIFLQELNTFRSNSEKLILNSAILEEKYHAQVKIKPINLFMLKDGGRFSIEPLETGDFRLKRKKVKYTKEELINLIETEPELFSPNVLLRPIVQDYLFPTGFYIGGPGEISYFAQLNLLYDLFNLHQPVIYPRVSATLVEKNVLSLFEKYELDFIDAFSKPEKIYDLILKKTSDFDPDSLFENIIGRSTLLYNELCESISSFDKTTADAGERYKQRAEGLLSEYKSKVKDAQKKKNEVIERHALKIENAFAPNKNLQERELNIFYFINKYGFGLIDKLFNELNVSEFNHQIIEL